MSNAPFEIREMRPADYAGAVALWRSVEGVEVAEGDDEHEIALFLERNPGLSRIARDGERIAGAALCGHDGRRGWIYHLAVAPEFRGRGLAKSLVDQCIAGLRSAGIQRAIILVAGDNPGGMEFWQRAGWELIDGAVPMTRDV